MSLPATDVRCLHEFIDRLWTRWPDRLALDIPPGRDRPSRQYLTYTDLVRASRRIQAGIQRVARRGQVIAILLPRTTPDSFAAMLAILRSGAAYLALDPSTPDGRLAEYLADASPLAVITDETGASRLDGLGIAAPRVCTSRGSERSEPNEPAESPEPVEPPEPGDLAYLIYTSGTTGRPKGVMVEHRAIVNLIAGDVAEFGLGDGDRVAQGSSLAYDSSLEEIWLAWSAGATVVVMDDETARAGPDVLPWLEREAITVVCPPPTLLRATGARSPDGLLPRLRLVYVGGEAVTDDVVRVWAPGRRFVNGYGPTECTVVATRADLTCGQPITIGWPVPGLSAWILSDRLDAVREGEAGELCLGGLGLARGYWNRPDLTDERFPVLPGIGRVYRTGDLVRRDAAGALVYLGRLDTQVKIRGHRVELEEIEARLAAEPGVRAAACAVQASGGRQRLVAFVVPARPADSLDPAALRASLGRVLPVHMVPAHIGVLVELPVTTGGKIDRTRLPLVTLPSAGASSGATGDEAAAASPSSCDRRIAEAARRLLGDAVPLDPETHFFADAGGDSLFAAELVSALRADPVTAGLTVRDVYESPTIAALAARAGALAAGAPVDQGLSPSPPVPQESAGHPMPVTLGQIAWLTIEVVVLAAFACAVVLAGYPALAFRTGDVAALLLLPVAMFAAMLAYLPLSIALVVAIKRLVVGRYRPARVPVWSGWYLRHWIVRQSTRLVPWRLFEGTVFHLMTLRALGARIGRRVHIHRGVDLRQGGWDLLTLGDDVTLGQDAVLRLVDLDAGHLVTAPVRIGDGATVDIRASVAGGATIEARGYLTALSSLPPGATLPAGERWHGVPAQSAGAAPPVPIVSIASPDWPPTLHGVVMLSGRLASWLLTPAIAVLAAAWASASYGIDAASVVAWLQAPAWNREVVWPILLIGVLPGPASVVAQAVLARLIGPRTPGVMSRWSAAYLRVWLVTDLVRRAGDWLSGTLMWPMWLRAAGMRIGRNCEISTIIDAVPGLVTIGPSTFFADGVYLGGPRIHRGTVTLARTTLGARVFLGNHVVIPAGAVVGDDVLVGVSTVADERAATAGSSWFGHPAFALSRSAPPDVDPRFTHDPPLVRYINRWLWELARFLLPIAPLVAAVAASRVWLVAYDASAPWRMALVNAPAAAVGAAGALCLFVLALKWLLLGRVRPGQHPLWSCWCSRWDLLYVAWGRLARPFLSLLDGTLLLAWYLRAMGMRIGRRVVLGPGFAQVVDPDMIRIDDGATVHALFQAHTFEDRVLKIDRIRVRAASTVECGAVVFYGADIGEAASVAAQSVVMKNEVLPAGGRYEGAPAGLRTGPPPSPTRPDRCALPTAPWADPASS